MLRLNRTLGGMKANAAILLTLELIVSTVFLGAGGSRASAAQSDRISLAGTWRFELDRANTGMEERWFERRLPEKIKLPGSLPAQGIGDDISVETKWTGDIVDKSWFTAPEYAQYRQPGNIKVPFWLQPRKVLRWRGVVSAGH